MKSWLIGKDYDAGRDWGQEEKGMTEDEMAGWHHWLGQEFGWTLGVGDGEGGLACCISWGCKESDATEQLNWAELVAQTVKNLPPMQETWVQSLGREDPLVKGMATHSSILFWKIPWTEEPVGLQSLGSQKSRFLKCVSILAMFCFKIVLAIWGCLRFRINFRMSFSKEIKILTGILL